MRWLPGWILALSLSSLGTATAKEPIQFLRHRTTTTNTNVTAGRSLMSSGHQHFRPLECNRQECSQGSTTWTAENYDPTQGTVVIPCGLCVEMDYVGDEDQVLELPHGLEIHGSLRFPNNYRLTMETPFIVVQGFLRMASTRMVTDVPVIQVKLTGTDDVSFLPIDNNQDACDGGPCDVGAQPIAVAGGRVEFRGVPASCKTWVRLHDVVEVTSTEEPLTLQFDRPPILDESHANPSCRTFDPYVNDDFESETTLSLWTGGYGAFYGWTQGFLRVSGRKDALEHAPTLDLLPFQDCLIPDATYLFSARVRLHHASLPKGTPTDCKDNGDDCLALQYSIARPNARAGSRKGREFPSDAFSYDTWEDFYTSFTFSADEIGGNVLYQLLRLRGPTPEVDIHVDDVSFGLAPPSLFPDPNNVCGGNLIMNGDAEASSIHPFPVEASGGRLDIFTTGIGNRIFRMTHRSSDSHGVQQHLAAPQCLKTGAQYSVRARVRFLSQTPVSSEMMVRIFFENGSSTLIQAATCPATGTTWDHCDGKFTVVDEFESDSIVQVRVFFETQGAPDVTMDVDNWQMEVSRPPKSGIVVPSEGVVDCWGEGVEIALTSHTLDFNDAQVRHLVSEPVDLENGLARLELDDVIIFPVTSAQSEDFAVEVALLNRNIRFEGGTERNNKGGHMIVMHTPDVIQRIRGVEFRNFGRLGELGRYPIHMHLCESSHSVIEKNLIIDSNQRCVVLHGTHNTTVSENVGFRTAGHCFMTEDGGEMDNIFIENMGASTLSAGRTVRAGETDATGPSTFWISNPKNHFIGNVAAGSEAHGFWFELGTKVRSPSSTYDWAKNINPRMMPLLTFKDNSAHSNYRTGFRTYPHGFFPPTVGIFENIRSYKNRIEGLFIRSSENIMVEGGVFADNQIQMDFEIAHNITVDGTLMIGRTDRFHEIVEAQGEQAFSHDIRLIGIELHVRSFDLLDMGTTIRNVEFSGFDKDYATISSLFDVDVDGTRDWDGIFSFWTLLENVSVDDLSVTTPFDLTRTTTSNHAAVYLVDHDSSLKPLGTVAQTSSTIIADLDDVKAFCDLEGLCHHDNVHKYWYCRNTCLRTVIFAVDPTMNANGLVLEVVDTTDSSRSFSYSGAFATEFLEDGSVDQMANTDWQKYLSFAAALPVGSYEARFKRGTNHVWPTFAEIVWGPALCNQGATPDSVQLLEPFIGDAGCSELIRNGDMEDGSTTPWLHAFGAGVAVEPNEGRSGSTAVGDLDQSKAHSGIGQYVDTRCLQAGITYEIRAWVRLERPNGLNFLCGVTDCGPKLKFRTMSSNDGAVGVGTPLERDIRPLANRLDGVLEAGWHLLYAEVTLDEVWTEASSVFVYVERGRTDARLFLDDFSMTRVD